MDQKISKIWWLWLPCAFMVAQIFIEVMLPHHILEKIHDENGPHEMIQFVVVFAAFIVAVRALLSSALAGRPWLRAWVALAAVCCFYVAGEEISWGQQLFHWATPEYWAQVNDQNETNLHNTSSWLDQKPKMLLELGVGVGGLLIPFLMRFRPQWVPERFNIIYPPAILGATAGFAVGLLIAHKIEQGAHIHLFTRANEVQELYLYYFTLLYLIILRGRILAARS